MSVDREYNIKITTVSDPAGAEQAKKGLEGIGDATKQGGKEAEKSEISHRALHQILHLIGHEAGPEAGAALAAVAAAATGGMMMGIMAVGELFELIKQGSEEAKHFKEVLEEPIDLSGMVKEIRGVKKEFEDASKTIDDFLKKLHQKSEETSPKKGADEQIAQLQRIAEAEKRLAAEAAEREKARLEMLKATHQISEADYKAGVDAANSLKGKKDSEITGQLEAKSTAALQSALESIKSGLEATTRDLAGAGGKPGSEEHLKTLQELIAGHQKKLDDLEKLQGETPSWAAAFVNSFTHPFESVEQFRQRKSGEAGAGMDEQRAAIANLQKQIEDATKNAPDKVKIKELEDKLTILQSDFTSTQAELDKRSGQGAIDKDAGAASAVQKFLEAQGRLGSHQGTAEDSQTISAMNQLLASTRKSDGQMYLLLKDLIEHKGDLSAALAELATQTANSKDDIKTIQSLIARVSQ